MYLGVDRDHLLTFDNHLVSMVNKTTQKLYVFHKIGRFINQLTAIAVYKLMMLPLLECSNFVFDSGKKSKVDKIDKVHSKCVRISEE